MSSEVRATVVQDTLGRHWDFQGRVWCACTAIQMMLRSLSEAKMLASDSPLFLLPVAGTLPPALGLAAVPLPALKGLCPGAHTEGCSSEFT